MRKRTKAGLASCLILAAIGLEWDRRQFEIHHRAAKEILAIMHDLGYNEAYIGYDERNRRRASLVMIKAGSHIIRVWSTGKRAFWSPNNELLVPLVLGEVREGRPLHAQLHDPNGMWTTAKITRPIWPNIPYSHGKASA